MDLKEINRLYAQEEKLLQTGQFGQGLWPVDMGIGQFLAWLIRFFGLRRGIEVGAGVGMSTGFLMSGFLVSGGKLTCFEYFPPKVKEWERNMERLFSKESPVWRHGASNFETVVELVPAEFSRWVKHAGRQKIDFVFFDQRKSDYLPHLKLIFPKLKKGAFICADNVLSHPESCQEYLDFVRKNKRFESACLEIGAGLEVTRYLG